jgi:hypothetical protein
MTTDEFSKWFSDIKGIQINNIQEDRVFFECLDEVLLFKLTKTAEVSDTFLSIHTKNKKYILFCLHNSNFEKFVYYWNKKPKKKNKDLSLLTCKQMASELKKRKNLTFALVWMEEDGIENFNIEAVGNPTMLCGMLTRGVNMTANWAESKTKYEDEEEEDIN